MNEIKLSGHVRNIYMNYKTDALVAELYVYHDHVVGKQSMPCKSLFTVVMTDYSKIQNVEVQKDDDAVVTGYLKEDFTPSQHRKYTIYATSIERRIA